MKKLFFLLAIPVLAGFSSPVIAQKKAEDKSKRPSPPATVSETVTGGAKVTISYSKPAVKGRVIGTDVEPMEGKIWRAGANEATVFETNKPLMVEGKMLAAGKYAFFTIKNGQNWTLIFNKTWQTWGAYDYDKNKDADALQVEVQEQKGDPFAERLTYKIAKDGKVSLMWGDKVVAFTAVTAK